MASYAENVSIWWRHHATPMAPSHYLYLGWPSPPKYKHIIRQARVNQTCRETSKGNTTRGQIAKMFLLGRISYISRHVCTTIVNMAAKHERRDLWEHFNTLRPEKNGRFCRFMHHFYFWNVFCWLQNFNVLFQISLKFISEFQIDGDSTLAFVRGIYRWPQGRI